MRQASHRFSRRTPGRGLFDITDEVARWVSAQGIAEGLLTLFVPHTSASLTIQENADPDVVRDLDTFFSRLAPDDVRLYRHTAEGADDMPAHIRAALTATQLAVPLSAAASRSAPGRESTCSSIAPEATPGRSSCTCSATKGDPTPLWRPR